MAQNPRPAPNMLNVTQKAFFVLIHQRPVGPDFDLRILVVVLQALENSPSPSQWTIPIAITAYNVFCQLREERGSNYIYAPQRARDNAYTNELINQLPDRGKREQMAPPMDQLNAYQIKFIKFIKHLTKKQISIPWTVVNQVLCSLSSSEMNLMASSADDDDVKNKFANLKLDETQENEYSPSDFFKIEP